MKEYIYYGELFNIYKSLLSEKNSKYYSLYYEDNLSLNEIANLYNVSKSYIGTNINKTTKKLMSYESNLHLYEKRNMLINSLDENNISKIKDIINKII